MTVAGGSGLTFVAATIFRMWHIPKRVDRMEKALPVIAKGLWSLLKCHVNGNPEINGACDDLQALFTASIVGADEQK